ncbi:MAG: flagellar basal body rod protein FlgB [Thermodesulfobacteriota bacterium]
MPVNKLYGGSIAIMRQALDLRLEKQGLIQSNIANQETPGYTTKDFSFARVMERTMSGTADLRRTHAKHLTIDPVEATKSGEYAREARPVDLDEEMVKLAENQLMYQVTTRLITKKFEGLRYVIDEGGK